MGRRLALAFVLTALLLLCQAEGGQGAANTCPFPREGEGEDAGKGDLEESINDTLEQMESETAQLARDMETLGQHLRGDEDYSQEDALTDELNNLHDFANSDDGAALYEQLKELNEQLEASGVKAFGEMEEASYRKQGGTGDWVVPALKEDIEACKTELQMQEEEAAAAAGGGEEPPQVKLRASDAEEAPAAAPTDAPSIGLRSENTEEKKQEGDKAGSPDEECKSCDALDEDMKEAEDEGARLFAELKELNPLVKEQIYKRNGDWRMDTLREDIAACTESEGCGEGGEEAQEDLKLAGGGLRGGGVEDGKEERAKKLADMFAGSTLDGNLEETAKAEADKPKEETPKVGLRAQDDEDERAC